MIAVAKVAAAIKARAGPAHFGMVALPIPSGYSFYTNCRANAVGNRNADGLVQAAGYCTSSGKKRAVRWDIQVGTSGQVTPPVLR